jgi:hypothetical protein
VRGLNRGRAHQFLERIMVAVRAHRLLLSAHEQFTNPAALAAEVFKQGHVDTSPIGRVFGTSLPLFHAFRLSINGEVQPNPCLITTNLVTSSASERGSL